ncbi:MAG: hypothetical protein EU535_07575 [Promethearchaeota archaeon]|nr:MAG: hypothetical protein EU535_07575 [Candidatus Lokiarchaeota archaeon]
MNEDRNNTSTKKKEILSELLVSEEHSLEDMKEIVALAKDHIEIEKETGKIRLSWNKYSYTTNEKIVLYLIGKFIAKELELNEVSGSTSREISADTDVVQTSLSGPLGNLIDDNRIYKEENLYSIKYYRIKEELKEIKEKYLQKISDRKEGVISPKKKRVRKSNIKTEKNEIICSSDKEHESKILKNNNLTKDKLEKVSTDYNGDLILLETFGKEGLRVQQIKGTILALTLMHIKTGTWEMNSSYLRKILEKSGIRPLTSLSTNIKRFPKYVVHRKGPIGSRATKYQLTTNGLVMGIKLIKDITDETNTCTEFEIKNPKSSRPSRFEEIHINNETLAKNLKGFLQTNKMEENKLRMKFEFLPDGIKILDLPEENTRRSIQIKSLLMIATLLKKIYETEKFSAKEALKKSRIPTDRLDLLSANKEYGKCFNSSPGFPVRLSYYGEKKGLELVKEYCGGSVD